ncbi:hypothetical protein Tco_0789012 [Tanacetum coccineum]
MHDFKESADIQEDSDYESMPKDDLRFVSEFETADSHDTQGNDLSNSDLIFQDDNAFAEHLSLQDHLDHIYEEVSSLHLKLRDIESSIINQVSTEIKSALLALVTTVLQEQLPRLLSDTLKDCLPSIIQESLQTHILTVSEQFAEKQIKLKKKFSLACKKSGMILRMFCKDVQGEKNKKAKDANPAATQEEHQPAEPLVEPLVESQGEQPANLKVANNNSAPPALDDKKNEGKELVVHSSEEKKSEGLISVEDDLDEDDKQPLSKRFKIMNPISDIPNPIPLDTFAPEHLLKPKEQQKSIQ